MTVRDNGVSFPGVLRGSPMILEQWQSSAGGSCSEGWLSGPFIEKVMMLSMKENNTFGLLTKCALNSPRNAPHKRYSSRVSQFNEARA